MGNFPKVDGRAPIHAFYSTKSWIEGNAAHQLETVAAMPGILKVAGMPDLHPGKYGPVGCAILADAVYPGFVGSDIGCGMGLYRLDVAARKLRVDKLAERMRALEGTWDGDGAALLREAGLAPTPFDHSVGTVGGGNHFCEVQAVDEIIDAEAAAHAGLERDAAYVLVHSGSRGLGFSILESVLMAGATRLDPDSDAGRDYLKVHDEAVTWARVNRLVLAVRAAEAARAEATLIADLSHNFLEVRGGQVLHRKGAAAADRGLVPIPGSRETLSYLVEPLAGASVDALASLAHGAGRKYDRSSMHGRVGTKRSELEALTRNPFGGLVICDKRELLVEEAGVAYKSIDRVIADLAEFGLARVVATFKPIVTFKNAGEQTPAGDVRSRDKTRNRGDRR
jgi:release factor H-coupled RctB family protein